MAQFSDAETRARGKVVTSNMWVTPLLTRGLPHSNVNSTRY
jgi:hypothetical protein